MIDNPRDLISPKGFLLFLDGLRSLKSLTILFGMDRAVTDDIFIHLASRPGLQSLGLKNRLTPQLISDAERRQQGKQLFPHLLKLVCTAESGGFLALAPHLSQLTHLELTLVDNATSTANDGIFSQLATACPNLQSLEIEYAASEVKDISPDELIFLALTLQHLQALHLHGKNIGASDLRDAGFGKVAEALPKLSILRLPFQCGLTEEALRRLGKSCGGTLVECELWGRYNLLSLEGEGVLFPVLEELTLGEVVSSAALDQIMGEAGKVAALLKKCAPKLQRFESEGKGPFDTAVEAAWRELSNQH